MMTTLTAYYVVGLKNVYNDYRKNKGLEPLSFDKNPSDPVTLQHCMDFLLKCVKEEKPLAF